MKIEKEIKLKVEFDSDEISVLRNAQQILVKLQRQMEDYHCDTILCCDEYTYDIRNLAETIGNLEMYENITEVFS